MKFRLLYWCHMLEQWMPIMTSDNMEEIEAYKKAFPKNTYKVDFDG